MREIKFRAVGKTRFPELNKMCYGTGIFEDGINTWLLSHDPTKCLADGFDKGIVDKDTIGQFTGLKDKNGKEIYEGDILRHAKLKIMSVRWNPDGEWMAREDSIGISEILWRWAGVSEVIGNIYENPELLKEAHG